MAIYIKLEKISENEFFAYYRYEFHHPIGKFVNSKGKIRNELKLVSGKVKINKKNGECSVIEIAEGDKGTHAQLAALKLFKHWEKGEYPERTCWAS